MGLVPQLGIVLLYMGIPCSWKGLGNLGFRVPRKNVCVLANDLDADGVRKRKAKH